jgi:hypothetical protein
LNTISNGSPRDVGALPYLVIDGCLRLLPRPPVCHGYANGCACADCVEREREQTPKRAGPAPRQSWEPRTTTLRDAA